MINENGFIFATVARICSNTTTTSTDSVTALYFWRSSSVAENRSEAETHPICLLSFHDCFRCLAERRNHLARKSWSFYRRSKVASFGQVWLWFFLSLELAIWSWKNIFLCNKITYSHLDKLSPDDAILPIAPRPTHSRLRPVVIIPTLWSAFPVSFLSCWAVEWHRQVTLPCVA